MATFEASESRLLRVTEVARRLNVSSVTVYRRIWEGSLPAFRIGDGSTALRVDSQELERWLHRSASSRPVRAMAERVQDPTERDPGTLFVGAAGAPAGQKAAS
jgi:excisionase family DNA binding protein